MSWFLIIILAFIVFANRYILLEPNIPLKLPQWFQDALQYSAPCLLAAIATPIIFMTEQGDFRAEIINPYLLGALITIVLAYLMKSMLLTIILSLMCFYSLVYYLA